MVGQLEFNLSTGIGKALYGQPHMSTNEAQRNDPHSTSQLQSSKGILIDKTNVKVIQNSLGNFVIVFIIQATKLGRL
uniref:Uncharacterized protein n=1 Tax=Timema genevievae TaxID=629358 RepID=A0A7R9JPR3_TIMGE|nr:unnamed protein product [Timema genevievae]